jgi:acyl carrier protein phosphodiesterase
LNWLAHFVLSPADERARLGGWLADVLTPTEVASISDPRVLTGIRLHREIDRLTDAHPAVLESRSRLPEGIRRYAGIVLDVTWDHFLSLSFDERVGRDLNGFVEEVHGGLLRQRPSLTAEVAAVVDRMVAESWLTCYRDAPGVELTLRRIAHRLSPRARARFSPEAGRRLIEVDHARMEAAFGRLWPDLVQLASTEGVVLPMGSST